MIIAIPSKGRPGKVKSLNIIPSATLYVPQSEYQQYASIYAKTKVISVPNEIKGITRTRNWILDNTSDPWVTMIDDDVLAQGYVNLRRTSERHVRLTESVWIGEFVKLFEVTEQMGYRVWGVATDGAARSFYPWRPFIFRTYVTASCCGLLNYPAPDKRRIRFDETFPVKEDYELCLRAIAEDGGIIGCRYMYWQNSHWKDAGGCSSYRTQSIEETAIERLIAFYPQLIRRVTRGGSEYSIELEFTN